MRCAATALVLAVAASACSAGGGGAYDGGVDGGLYEVSLTLPDGCPPEAGNEKGVGAPCSKGGGQCKGDLHCACDSFLGVQLTGVPCICTLGQLAQTGSTDPCGAPLPKDFCGTNATCCPYETAAAFCVPSICLPGGACPDFTGP